MIAATARCREKLNDDAFIAALFHIGIRDTFFTREESARYWLLLGELYLCEFSVSVIL
jgi:hypothetical protein